MVKHLYYLVLLLMILNFVLLITGLYKPWIVLWWLPRQNRKLVIKIYGLLGVLLFLLTFMLCH